MCAPHSPHQIFSARMPFQTTDLIQSQAKEPRALRQTGGPGQKTSFNELPSVLSSFLVQILFFYGVNFIYFWKPMQNQYNRYVMLFRIVFYKSFSSVSDCNTALSSTYNSTHMSCRYRNQNHRSTRKALPWFSVSNLREGNRTHTWVSGLGVGRSPPPGRRPATALAGASRDRAFVSSGITPAEKHSASERTLW